jgi:hypothetical protein
MMASEDAKIALANLMIRKIGLIKTARHELHKKTPDYWAELTEIVEAVERVKKT